MLQTIQCALSESIASFTTHTSKSKLVCISTLHMAPEDLGPSGFTNTAYGMAPLIDLEMMLKNCSCPPTRVILLDLDLTCP